jgi:hypothetical protein
MCLVCVLISCLLVCGFSVHWLVHTSRASYELLISHRE